MIARLYDAYGRGDVDGIMACYVDNLAFHVAGPEPTAGDHAGKASLRAILEQYMPLLEGVDREVLDTVEEANDRIAVRLRFRLSVAGERVTNTALHMHRLEGDLIAETWVMHLDEEVTRKFWDEHPDA